MFNILSFITDQKLSFVFLAAHLGPVFLREYAHISYTKTADWKSSLFCTLSQGFVTRGSIPSLPWELRLGRRLLVDKPTNIYARKKNVILHWFRTLLIYIVPSCSCETIVISNTTITLTPTNIGLACAVTSIVTVSTNRANIIAPTFDTSLARGIPIVRRDTGIASQSSHAGQTRTLAITRTLKLIWKRRRRKVNAGMVKACSFPIFLIVWIPVKWDRVRKYLRKQTFSSLLTPSWLNVRGGEGRKKRI